MASQYGTVIYGPFPNGLANVIDGQINDGKMWHLAVHYANIPFTWLQVLDICSWDTKNKYANKKYFQVDMLEQYPVYKVVLENRRNAGFYARLRHTEVRIGDTDVNESASDSNPLCYTVLALPTGPTVECPCPLNMLGRYVLVRKIVPEAWHLNEVRIFSEYHIFKM